MTLLPVTRTARAALSFAVALATAAATAAVASSAPAETPLDTFLASVHASTLPNGLTLLVREQPGTGVVAIDTWVKAGYFHEPDEVAGMAHLFEHMFFKGSQKFPGAEQIAQELAAVGGQSNAGTIYDSTNYYFVVPKEGFAKAAEIMADAVANPRFDPEELAREAEVVIEESNRKQDSAGALSTERMLATSFTQHRIKRWRIGSNEVLRNIRRDDLLAFFHTLYRPGNMIVAVAGDVTAAEARALVGRTFGALPVGVLDKHRGPQEPPQGGFRYGRSTGDIQQGYSVLGWHTVGIGAPEEQALDLAADILGGGRSARFFRHVVGPDGAATADASHWQFEDVGVFIVQASFDEQRRSEVDRRLLAEVERLKAHGPTEYELRLAKNRIASQLVLGLESALGQAQTLAYVEANWGYATLGDRLAELEALTAEAVRDAARRHLMVDKLTLYHYAPDGAAANDRETALAEVRAATATAPAAEAAAELPPAPAPVPGAGAERPASALRLANGATLIVRERPGAPSVSFGVYLLGGRTGESSANAGITRLAASALRRGTATRSGEQIDRELEFLGTQLELDVDNDAVGLTLDVLRTNLRPALDLAADVMLRPTFPPTGVDEERALQLAAIRRSFDSAFQRPATLAYAALFGTHPYGISSLGTADSISTLSPADLASWWRDLATAENAVLVLVGDVDAAAARALVESAFAGLPRSGSSVAELRSPPALPARIETIEYRNRKQSAIVMAFPAPPPGDPDAPRLELLQRITSGLAGTFFAELRGRRSLAYTVFASYQPYRETGVWFAYLASDAAKEPEAKEALLAELRRLATDGFSAEDLARGKSSFAGSTRIGLQTNAAVLRDLVTNHVFGLGLDGTEKTLAAAQATTLEELRAAAGRYAGAEAFATAILRGQAPAPGGAEAP